MANISQYLAAIMSAVYGRDVRKSIHDAIKEVNTAQEQAINAGTAISAGDPAGGVYASSLYFNTNDNELLECDGTTWNVIDNLEGNGIDEITGPVTDPSNPLVDVYTITFTKTAGTKDFEVTNAKSIVNITLYAQDGLVDTYHINYNDDTFDAYAVNNGTIWLYGTEITGTPSTSTGYTLTTDDCKAGYMYFNVTDGSIYKCDIGADAGDMSYWTFLYKMAGGGGSQFLYALNDVQQSSVQSPTNGQILKYDSSVNKWVASYGGSGHTMNPTPASTLTEDAVVTAVNGATKLNDEVSSLFGIQRWSNVKRFRIPITSGIGHYGIGEWKDAIASQPTKAQEQGWGWFYHEALKKLGDLTNLGYDYDLSFKYQTGSEEPILYGGHILDTQTGCICIRFANYVVDIATAKVFIDITVTRNDILV